MRGKKAEISGEVITVIPKIIFLIAVLFAFIILVKSLIVTSIDIRQVESEILVNRILFSEAISYNDKGIDRLYPGIIDLKKFEEISKNNPNSLDTTFISYGSDNPIITSKITLKQANKKDIVAFYNREKFVKWEPRALPGITGGAGRFKTFKEQKYVLVKEGEKLTPAVLEFFIIS